MHNNTEQWIFYRLHAKILVHYTFSITDGNFNKTEFHYNSKI